MKVTAKTQGNSVTVFLAWGTTGYLPFRLRLLDPAGEPSLRGGARALDGA